MCSCNSELEKETIEGIVVERLSEWAENPSFSNDILDPKIIEQFQDSGLLENGLKEGLWIEYSLDNSLVRTITVEVGDKQTPLKLGATLEKQTGTYFKGKRQGAWIMYNSRDKKAPFYWNRDGETDYRQDEKHGKEIIYQGFGEEYQRPLLIRHWENGVENGIGKMYFPNHPYELQQVYNAVDGHLWLLEKFYPNGQLETKFTDTILEGRELKYMRTYYESGQLKLIGYYTLKEDLFGRWTSFYRNAQIEIIKNYENGKLHGKYEYFHDNRQVWTERTYKEGKLWNVHSNFNRRGRKKDRGTIINGTGTLNLYDTEGMLTESVEYVNGLEKKD
ncbi:MAG: hypothetical protein COB85_01150 [Bacteroidetes bacterium]|nr:MAG: hypothetical protein COB85_01150 [Bacteroidota bacterium]